MKLFGEVRKAGQKEACGDTLTRLPSLRASTYREYLNCPLYLGIGLAREGIKML